MYRWSKDAHYFVGALCVRSLESEAHELPSILPCFGIEMSVWNRLRRHASLQDDITGSFASHEMRYITTGLLRDCYSLLAAHHCD